MKYGVNALFVIMIPVKVIFMCPMSISHLHTHAFSSSCDSLRSARGTVCKSGAYLWATQDLGGPSTTWAQPPESLKSDFGIHFPSSHSRPSAPSRPERHLPPPTSEQPFNICARIFSQFSIHAVRHTRPTFYIYICDANENIKTQESGWVTCFCIKNLHQYADTRVDVTLSFFFFYFFSGEVCVIGELMVTEGYGSPPSLALGQDDGSGWLTVRKYHLGMAGDTFIEPVKLTKAISLARTRVTITHKHIHMHACMDRGRGKESTFLKSRSCASIKHWSLCHLGLFRAPAELFDVSGVRKEMWTEFYLTNSAPQTAGIHSKLLERQTSNYTGKRWADVQIHS